MTRTDKTLLYTIIAAALPIVIGTLVFVSPRSQARRNQTKLLWLLAKAHEDLTQPIRRVVLGDGTTLVPDRNQVVVGYVLRLHLQSTGFTVEAQPVKSGVTGLLSYYRDSAGVIRFDTSGKKANAESRPTAQSLLDHAP